MPLEENPLVTCLCLTTGNRPHWLAKAIDCYERQAYANRELVVVAPTNPAIGDEFKDRIRTLLLGDWITIGAKRNAGCAVASGSVVCHWDDDDYSAPGRIEDQLRHLRESGKAVTGYHSMKFTDGARWWQYRGSPGFVLGTSLCYERAWWQKYPFDNAKHIGEDSEFLNPALVQRQLAAIQDMNLMYATIHPENSSPRVIAPNNWRQLHGFKWSN